jgi:DNA repair exonuclease SbcCD ATPase subunit
MSKDITTDDAMAALGQMANFFKAFRRVEDVVQYMHTAEGRMKEIAGGIDKLEADLAEKARQHTQVVTAQDEVLSALKKKIKKAEEALTGIEEAANEQTAAAEAKVAAIEARAVEAAAEAKAAQEAADVQLAETLAAADEAEARVQKAKEALAAMMAAGN